MCYQLRTKRALITARLRVAARTDESSEGNTMKLRTTAAAAIAVTAAYPASVLLASTASAATVHGCTTSHSYSHSVTGKGTVTDEWVTKSGCYAGWYDRREVRVTHSYTGAHSYELLTRDQDGQHFEQTEQLWSWSKTGTETYRVTVTSG